MRRIKLPLKIERRNCAVETPFSRALSKDTERQKMWEGGYYPEVNKNRGIYEVTTSIEK